MLLRIISQKPFISTQFQIDGNLAYLAAVNEMLVQCHTPGIIILLPALPTQFPRGSFRLHCRGNALVNLSWSRYLVTSVSITMNNSHPWYEVDQHIGSASMIVASPNRLHLDYHDSCAEQFMNTSGSIFEQQQQQQQQQWKIGLQHVRLQINRFPCRFDLKDT